MKELISKRGWDSKRFDTGKIFVDKDNKEIPVYGERLQNGLHDIEPDGSFVEVDTLFMPADDGDETDRVKRTRCGRLSISNKLDTAKDSIKVLTKNGNGIRLKLRGYKTYGPHFDDLKSCYYTTDEGYILRYYPHYKGIKLVIEIPNPTTATNVFRFVVNEIGCTYTYQETVRGIRCISSTGEDNIYLGNSIAEDGNGDTKKVTLKLGELTAQGKQLILKVIPPVWLGNATTPVRM